jgi:hypothetical protein
MENTVNIEGGENMTPTEQVEEKKLPDGYIPKDQRKKILLLSDDLRMPSGVGVISREIVLGTAHKYNWVQLGAAINHPEAGRIMDASESLSKELGIPDASLRIYPSNGYGDPQTLRFLMMQERPDAIMHFTDPRYWIWLYEIEHEIRDVVPLLFYHVWDDLPFPLYNEDYYRSCDWIACISRQTYNIVRNVWKKDPLPEKWQVKYIPHGVDPKVFRKLTTEEELAKVEEARRQLFGNDDVDFVVLYNNRNIRRKMTGDVVLAFWEFFKSLPEDKRVNTRLLMHTARVDDNGTDIPALIKGVCPELEPYVVFNEAKVDPHGLNVIYNLCDVVINMASNEGFGIATLEGMMAEKMIVANVTGGLQDQMGFVDEKGEYLNEDKHFGAKWGSNHDGKYKKHGEWVVPLFPNNRALIGSPPTPYIFDDRCTWEDAAKALRQIYDMTPEERQRRGKSGRDYALAEGYSVEAMNTTFMEGFDTVFKNWKPRKRFGIWKA